MIRMIINRLKRWGNNMKDNMTVKKFKVHMKSQDSEKKMIFNIKK